MTARTRSRLSVLVVDDDDGFREGIKSDLSGLMVDLRVVGTHRSAVAALRSHVVHLAFLDMQLGDKRLSGLDILDVISEIAPSCKVVLMTHIGVEYRRLLRCISPVQRVQIVGFVDKSPLASEQLLIPVAGGWLDGLWESPSEEELIRRWVEPFVMKWSQSELQVQGIDYIVEGVASRQSRYPRREVRGRKLRGIRGVPLRASEGARRVEIETLLRSLFGEIAITHPVNESKRTSRTKASTRSLRLTPLSSASGFSSAIVVNAEPVVGVSESGEPLYGNRCVVKIGPAREISAERQRYDELVRYGIAPDQRVELLGFAACDAMAAIVYSFAGGGRSAITPLGSLIANDETVDRAEAAIDAIFQADSKRWYAVDAGLVSIRNYFSRTYGGDKLASYCEQLTKWADSRSKKAAGWSVDGTTLRIGSARLRLPSAEFLGSGEVFVPDHAALVHGDLHSENVLVDDENRACLIDFRTAGVGPRSLDFAFLDGSLRFRDGQRLAALGSKSALGVAAATVDSERLLWTDERWSEYSAAADDRGMSLAPVRGLSSDAVGRLIDAIRIQLHRNYESIDKREFARACAFAALRLAAVADKDVVRLRALTWFTGAAEAL